MFQSFDDVSEGHLSRERVTRLREELQRRQLDGFIIPRQDEFQGEYVAPYAERLRWLTGFAGSWGLAILMSDRAAIFVDGRYTIQVRQQVDTAIFTPRHLVEEPPAEWLEKELKPGEILGYDPWLLTADQISRFEKAAAKAGAKLQPVDGNPIDAIWAEQPKRPMKPVSVQPTQFSGKSARDKLDDVAKSLEKAGADAVVLTQPDSVAWAFNIRGGDVAYTPVVLSYAILHRKGEAELFIDTAKLPEDVTAHLKSIVRLKAPQDIEASLASLGREKARVQIDPDWTPERIRAVLAASGAEIVHGKDPCVLPKARKNAIEQEGARAAQKRDGVAVTRFLCWLDAAAPKGGQDEVTVAQKLAEFRAEGGMLKDLSFDSISGVGPNAAIPHYRVSRATALPLKDGEIYLIDSGAQYQDGTTDITRTVIVGTPTAEMKDRFTRVLKGMIALSRIRFPKGTCGSQLDVLARQPQWMAGLDFDHGTGHGVGSYLSVHEGPARINKSDRTPLEPGMILSNEPGYYKEGQYGIRIENLILVREPEAIPGGERPMMSFETLTLCPIDRRLIEPGVLAPEERDWLNAYHARVEREIGAFLEGAELAWLKQACAPV
ncbi:aminopeptidase P family protein [Nordella sp. HKS 07]|uniref:aminopeptidase P family protein n=1 Tax=Nordella sp. HKS 07 TaxID=2712222 RepID=UPI0013E1B308|nr:aminopeptidase P family protein [Nordella sp. HKS 07]QIG51923.1 aminopeptidase P family protein [Nordella sp. HKS 07]